MPIAFADGAFLIETDNVSYWIRVTEKGHIETLYFGKKARFHGCDPFRIKHIVQTGMSVAYDDTDAAYSLDTLPLEWSGAGKGDLRFAPCEIVMPDGTYVTDFVYEGHEIVSGCVPMKELPTAYDDTGRAETLILTLKDKKFDVRLKMLYTAFADTDVISRRVEIENFCERPIRIGRLMSYMTSLPDRGYSLLTLSGGWAKECHAEKRDIKCGRLVNESLSGDSSNRHNPAFAIAESSATEDYGRVFGFNLIYSGNHFSSIELSNHGVVRVMGGISPNCFEKTLGQREAFRTPEAVMTYSNAGYNGMSRNFHDFVNEHIVCGEWKKCERPVLVNDWEAYMFDFTHDRLMRLAKKAKSLGIELFVLDDGWFGKRNSDTAGLGDYDVNRKKLPKGLDGLARDITSLGLSFGLWVEPESVNVDSDLYRAHPEYAITIDGRVPSVGRNQLLLDLCKKEVRDYIVENVGRTLDSADITYVKWDMNRHLSDMYSSALSEQGTFYHDYILGLYEVLDRIFTPRKKILFESCSSGGNRFDLGMLCYSPQVWSSDDTDPIERLSIQKGLSYFYPQSTMGAHVSQSPNMQTLRATQLSMRFNVAAFGLLGYEMDLMELSSVEESEAMRQIGFYKAHRQTLQYGRFIRYDRKKSNKERFTASGDGEAITGFFQTLARASEEFDLLDIKGLEDDALYSVDSVPQGIAITRFGGLIKHVLPIKLKADGFIIREAAKRKMLDDASEHYEVSGDALSEGIVLNEQFMGSGYDAKIRLLGDFGSTLYIAQRITEDGNDE